MRKNKERDIIEYFVKHSTSYISVNELSIEFGVSERQIKNYISKINKVTDPVDLILLSNTKKYKICNDYSDYLHLFEPVDYLPKERISAIISRLLFAKEPIDIFDLADEFYISRATLEGDLNKVKKLLNEFQLSLSIKKDSICMDGSEISKRKLTSYMITNDSYTNLISNSKMKYLRNNYKTDLLKNRLIEIFNEYNIIFNDYSLNNVILHLVVTIDRLNSHNEIADTLPLINVNTTYEDITKAIVSFIEDNYCIAFTKTEFNNLLTFLSCNLATIDYRFINDKNRESYISKECLDLTKEIIQQIQEYYFLDNFDEAFVSRFMLHISNLLNRMDNNCSAKNPLSAEIKRTYPLIYDIAVFVANIIYEKKKMTICQDEISFIALHIGSFLECSKNNRNKTSAIYVYSDYHGFYRYNIEKINKLFFETLDIKYTISINDYYAVNPKADVIISDFHISGKDIIIVSPFITNAEIEMIQKRVDHFNNIHLLKEFQKDFSYMFNKNLFLRDVFGANETEIINNILHKIQPYGYFAPEFAQEVIKREQLSSTAFNNDIAIPHAISQNIKRSFISFCCYSKSITWGKENVKLVILIGIAYHERKLFRSIFNQLIEVLSSSYNINQISNSTSYKELMDTINTIIEGKYKP